VFLFVLIIISFITNNLLIGPLGISGAALATLVSISAFNFLKYLYILWRFEMQPFSRQTLYIAFGIAVSVVPTFFFPQHLHPFLKAFFGGGITLLVFSLLNVKFEIIEEVNKLFRRFKLIR
jgi:O-antigen/teichoic acid export membrane protein